MDVLACATMAMIAGIAAGPMLEASEPSLAGPPPAPVEAAGFADRAPVSFRFVTREEGHEILLSDVHVRIEHPVSGTLFDGVSNGPFLVAFVPAGRYDVAASHEGRTKLMTLTIARVEPRSVAVYW